MYRCDEYQRLISDNLDEPLSPDVLVKLDQHLSECAACRAFLDAATRLREEVSSLPMQSSSQPLQSHRPSTPWWRRKIAVPVPTIAAGILLLLATWLAQLRSQNSSSTNSTIDQYVATEQIDIIKLTPNSATLTSPTRTQP